jgi:uncharacterized peroxidase-related enzyme
LSHARDFGRESSQPDLAEQLILDYRRADLDPADRALCDFAVKLTRTPGDMTEADIDALRVHGYDDHAITIAVQVIAYFNYINRVAEALGVDPDPWMTRSKDEWLRTKGRNYGESDAD